MAVVAIALEILFDASYRHEVLRTNKSRFIPDSNIKMVHHGMHMNVTKGHQPYSIFLPDILPSEQPCVHIFYFTPHVL